MGRIAPVPVEQRPVAKTRRVALLVGGPSLRESWNEELARTFDLVVAVNGAVFVAACDFAVMVDRPIVLKLLASPVRPKVALVTYSRAYQQRMVKDRVLATIRMMQIPTVGPRQKSYTMPRALKFCLSLAGPGGSVEVFGMDWTAGGVDVAGVKGDHGPRRWRQEAEVLRAVWDARVVAVHGQLNAARLAFIKGKSAAWPG